MRVTTKIVPRYAETDQMGIIHHSVYAIWYEEARSEFMNQIGLRYDDLEKSGIMTPLLELNCKYKHAAYYNKEIKVETRIVELTPAKFVVRYNLYNEEEKLINVGETTLAWADKNTFKIINLKKVRPELYEMIEKLVEKED